MKKIKVMIFIAMILTLIFVLLNVFNSFMNKNSGIKTYHSEIGSFSLETSINKAKVRVGESIEITSTFKNLSDKDLYIEFPDAKCYFFDEHTNFKLNDLFTSWLLPEGTSGVYSSIKAIPRYRTILPKETELTVTKRIKASESGKHYAYSDFWFYVGNDPKAIEEYKNSVFIQTDKIEIIIIR